MSEVPTFRLLPHVVSLELVLSNHRTTADELRLPGSERRAAEWQMTDGERVVVALAKWRHRKLSEISRAGSPGKALNVQTGMHASLVSREDLHNSKSTVVRHHGNEVARREDVGQERASAASTLPHFSEQLSNHLEIIDAA